MLKWMWFAYASFLQGGRTSTIIGKKAASVPQGIQVGFGEGDLFKEGAEHLAGIVAAFGAVLQSSGADAGAVIAFIAVGEFDTCFHTSGAVDISGGEVGSVGS